MRLVPTRESGFNGAAMSERPLIDRLSELPPAGLLRRVGALIYDGLLVIALVMTTAGLVNLFAARPEVPEGAESVSLEGMEVVSGPMLGSLIFVLVFTFFAYFWVRHGRTLGMQAWHLRVQTLEGYNITPMQALVRFFVAIPSLFLCFAGFFWMWLDPARMTLHDRVSGTRIVHMPQDLEAELHGRS